MLRIPTENTIALKALGRGFLFADDEDRHTPLGLLLVRFDIDLPIKGAI
jgi:hypothetical protein